MCRLWHLCLFTVLVSIWNVKHNVIIYLIEDYSADLECYVRVTLLK
jgi:hypothetical protein